MTDVLGETERIVAKGQDVERVVLAGEVLWSAGPTIFESFEHNDLVGNYTGDFGSISITDAWAADGTYSMVNDDDGDDGVLSSADPMTAGRDVHYRFTFHVEGSLEGKPKVYLFASGTDGSDVSGYGVEFDLYGPILRFYRIDDGEDTEFGHAGMEMVDGGTYVLDFYPELDGSLTLTAYDESGLQLAQLTGTDSTYTNGKIGYDGNVFTTSAYIDSFSAGSSSSTGGSGGGTGTTPATEYALKFDDADNAYAETPAIDVNGESFSVICRFRIGDSRDPYARVFQAGGSASEDLTNGWNTQWSSTSTSHEIQLRSDGSGGRDSVTTSLPTGEWLRLVIYGSGDSATMTTYDSSGAELVSTTTNHPRGQTADTPLYWMVGDGRYTEGDISEVAAFDRELTDSERAAYASGLEVPSDPIAEYPLNAGGGTTLADASGNGNDATAYNTTWTKLTSSPP